MTQVVNGKTGLEFSVLISLSGAVALCMACVMCPPFSCCSCQLFCFITLCFQHSPLPQTPYYLLVLGFLQWHINSMKTESPPPPPPPHYP